jgi:hypothetical protein
MVLLGLFAAPAAATPVIPVESDSQGDGWGDPTQNASRDGFEPSDPEVRFIERTSGLRSVAALAIAQFPLDVNDHIVAIADLTENVATAEFTYGGRDHRSGLAPGEVAVLVRAKDPDDRRLADLVRNLDEEAIRSLCWNGWDDEDGVEC